MPTKITSITNAMRDRIEHAASRLTPAARHGILDFVLRARNPDGGYGNRRGVSDIYYTAFALEIRRGLNAPDTSPELPAYLATHLHRHDLRLADRVCLIRALVQVDPAHAALPAHLDALEAYRSRDGGYAMVPGAARSSAYAPFLVSLAWADVGGEIPARSHSTTAVLALRRADGGFVNDEALPMSATPPSAAAAVFLQGQAGFDPEPTHAYLRARMAVTGGMHAIPGAPVPDLLSTATALHALTVGGASLAPLRDPCLSFVEEQWHTNGGFCAHALDNVPDCEYTYYGLLALGHLLL